MAIDFPISPTVNQTHTDPVSSNRYYWTGTYWRGVFAQGTKGDQGDKGDKGDAGFKGEQGIPGTAVAKGDVGPKGGNGSNGAAGAKGQKGEIGNDGPPGEPGAPGTAVAKGDKGDVGPKGEAGSKGEVGQKGDQGIQGIQGVKGDIGPQGDTGDQGLQGDQGIKGDVGDKGDAGSKGDKGDVGTTGDQGIQGIKGDTGDQGIQGVKGDTGDKGDAGTKGDVGPAPTLAPINYAQNTAPQLTTSTSGAILASIPITLASGPAQIIASGDANPLTAGAWGRLQIYRDSTPIGGIVHYESSAGNENVPYSLQFVDAPGAGTYTYSLRMLDATHSTQFGESTGPVITVTELGNVKDDKGDGVIASIGGSNTQVIFNDLGTANGVAGFTYDKVTSLFTTPTISVASANVTTSLQVGGTSTFGANASFSNNYIIAPTFKGYTEDKTANTATAGATTLDLSTTNAFDLTLTGNTTFTFTNPPASSRVYTATLILKQDATGGRTVTWPSGTKWPGAFVPPATTSANAVDIWSLMTYDGGTTWIVSLSIKNAS